MLTADSPHTQGSMPSLTAAELTDLANYFKQVSSIDLADYKSTVFMRRAEARMQQIGVKDYRAYRDLLEQHPEERNQFLDNFFINVTQFFRDPPVWAYLAKQVIPKLIADKAPDQPIRVWSAGCASGEEVYSLAMLLAEALGAEQFKQRVRIFGTDVDRNTLSQARQGEYPAHQVEAIPAALLERYFEPSNGGYRWRNSWYHPMLFASHDLVQSSPFAQIDLLMCRNTFIYLTQESQIRALTRFHFSLNDQGVLVLGRSETSMTGPHSLLFTAVDRQARVFTKVPDAHRNRLLLPLAFGRRRGADNTTLAKVLGTPA